MSEKYLKFYWDDRQERAMPVTSDAQIDIEIAVKSLRLVSQWDFVFCKPS